MILSVSNIGKSFSEKVILDNISFHLEDYDKAALVGINGVGKTTLLKIIVGELSADEGLVTFSRGKTLGYLAQNTQVSGEVSLYDSLLKVKEPLLLLEQSLRQMEEEMKQLTDKATGEATGKALEELMKQYADANHQYEVQGGYLYRSEIVGVLKGLGFSEEDFSRSLATLSGGQKTRVALGHLLLTRPDLIILDEPTNHLDMGSIAWLENYLLNYRGAVLIVSHDRYFLDKISSKVIELDQGRATVFQGNYSDYSVKKEQLRTAQWNAYLKQQQEIRHQEEVIEKLKSFNREKSIKRAESREKALNKIQLLEKPIEADSRMKLSLTPCFTSGKDVLTVEGLSKAFPPQTLFSDLSFSLKRGEHVAIIGDNGTGKTTLLKIINGLIPADSGSILLGANVAIGYYDQEHQVLSQEKTLMEEISDAYPYLTGTQIRNTLAAFLFTGEDVFKQIGSLSGGEQGRVALAKLMLSESNFLILDEPTNHLDILSREILETAINHYEGTLLYVSHDRYFINQTAHRILDLSGQRLTGYLGNYDYYLEKRPQIQEAFTSGNFPPAASGVGEPDSQPKAPASSQKEDYRLRKEEQAARRKKENALKKTEEEISRIETRLSQLNEEMALPENCSNSCRLQKLQQEKDELEEKLLELMETWEELSS